MVELVSSSPELVVITADVVYIPFMERCLKKKSVGGTFSWNAEEQKTMACDFLAMLIVGQVLKNRRS